LKAWYGFLLTATDELTNTAFPILRGE